jgi:hypothetical protein
LRKSSKPRAIIIAQVAQNHGQNYLKTKPVAKLSQNQWQDYLKTSGKFISKAKHGRAISHLQVAQNRQRLLLLCK